MEPNTGSRRTLAIYPKLFGVGNTESQLGRRRECDITDSNVFFTSTIFVDTPVAGRILVFFLKIIFKIVVVTPNDIRKDDLKYVKITLIAI